MTEALNWKEENLNDLIKNQVKESIDLDYKESLALQNNDKCKNELSKDVSAFANSAGGILIYGIKEDGNLPISIDNGSDPNVITKEWIEQVINSRIQRKISGILINQISLDKVSPGRVAYVIIIPQSKRSPHQAYDKKFYKRYNFESIPMEEYEIRDIATRETSPDLILESTKLNHIELLDFNSGTPTDKYTSFDLKFILKNESIEPAYHAIIRIGIESRLDFIQHGIKTVRHTIYTTEGPIELKIFEYNYGEINKSPIFNGLSFGFFDGRLKINENNGETDYYLYWELHSPKMDARKKEYLLKVERNNNNWIAKLIEK